ncbi:MAG: hypothetical protein JXR71_10175 [Bacteroidales bacterium]|nr:hypothetical protein [Bacteroidales bacterium]
MKGDIINLNDEHRRTASKIVEPLIDDIRKCKELFVFSVAGESGAGKSISAAAIAEQLEQAGLLVKIFQQDDYFYLPPFTNDRKRRQDLSWVGIQEVNLGLIDQHLLAAKNGVQFIEKPLVIYQENKITTEEFDMTAVRVCIAEGTYTSMLTNVDKRIFIDRNYFETHQDRKKRARDVMDPFTEQVLEIEHKIISNHKAFADIIIDKEFKVYFVK